MQCGMWNGLFINKFTIIHFIFSDHFPFLVALNKYKNKSMGNCISKINKNYFSPFEEEMKNECHFFKGTTRIGVEKCIPVYVLCEIKHIQGYIP